MLGRLKGEQGDVIVYAPQGALDHHRPRLEHQPHDAHPQGDRSAGQPARRSGSSSIKNTAATRDGPEAGRDLPGRAAGRKGPAAAARAPPPGGKRRAQGRRSRPTEMMISEDHPRRALEPADRHRQRARLRARAHAGARSWTCRSRAATAASTSTTARTPTATSWRQTLGAVTGVAVSGAAGGRARDRGAAADADADADAQGRRAAAPGPEPAVRGRGAHQLRSPDQLAHRRFVAEGLPVAAAGDRAARFAAQAGVRRGDDPGGHARQAARPRRLVPRRQAAEPVRARAIRA